MFLWNGRPIHATAYQEIMQLLNLSEFEARELEHQEQLLVDAEIARFPKSIQ